MFAFSIETIALIAFDIHDGVTEDRKNPSYASPGLLTRPF